MEFTIKRLASGEWMTRLMYLWTPTILAGPNIIMLPAKEMPIRTQGQTKGKYPKQYLIWQAIDESGNGSRPYVLEGTLNGETYLVKYIKEPLVPFHDEHHDRDKVIFWADMATVHFTKKVTGGIERFGLNVRSIGKENPQPKVSGPCNKCGGT